MSRTHVNGNDDCTASTLSSTPSPAIAALTPLPTIPNVSTEGFSKQQQPLDANTTSTSTSTSSATTISSISNNSAIIVTVSNQRWFDSFHRQLAMYDGSWDVEGQQPQGYGSAIYDENDIDENPTKRQNHIASYQGTFVNGLFHGPNGHLIYTNGDVYVGDLQQSTRHGGNGTYTWYDTQNTYRGSWQHNVRHGFGIFTFGSTTSTSTTGSTDSSRTIHSNANNYYEGEFRNGQRHGYGIFCWVLTGASYQGQWEYGLYHGTGKFIDPITTNTIYDGTFSKGEKHGSGQVYNIHGTALLQKEFWDHGTKVLAPMNDESNEHTENSATAAAWSSPDHTRSHNGAHTDTQIVGITTMFEATTFTTIHHDENHDSMRFSEIQKNNNCSIVPPTMSAFQHRPPPPSYPPPPVPTTTPENSNHHSRNAHNQHGTDLNCCGKRTAITVAERSAADCITVINQRVIDVDGYSGIYSGIVIKNTNRPHGVGKIRYDNRRNDDKIERYCIYEGFWRYGSKDGHGRNLFLPENDLYIGEYKYNVRNGYGQYFWKDGRTYDGHYWNDMKHGHGIFRYPNGESYVGFVHCCVWVSYG